MFKLHLWQDNKEPIYFKQLKVLEKFIAEKIDNIILPKPTVAILREIILNSNKCKNDSIFVRKFLSVTIVEKQEKEKMKLEQEKESKKMELDQQLELGRMQTWVQIQGELILTISENNASKNQNYSFKNLMIT